MEIKDVKELFKDKRFQWALVIVLLLIVLFWASSIRLSNWDLLTDQTTGEKIPLALDPYYFLRLAEVLVENDGAYPEFDEARYPAAKVGFTREIMPQATVMLYKIGNLFGEYSLREVNVFSPVLYFFVSLILFFILSYTLTNSKLTAIVASTFLAFVPAYLYRTTAGFSDHEAIGMVGFFLALLVYTLALKSLNSKKGLKSAFMYGFLTAFTTVISLVSWSGTSAFIFLIIPLSFLLFWITKIRKEKGVVGKGVAFYTSWVVFTILLYALLFNNKIMSMINLFLSGRGIIVSFVLLLTIVHMIVLANKSRLSKFRKYKEKYLLAYSLIITVKVTTRRPEPSFRIESLPKTKLTKRRETAA